MICDEFMINRPRPIKMCVKLVFQRENLKKTRILYFVQYGYHQTSVKEAQFLATRKKDYKNIVKSGHFSHKIAYI
jgi:hypothetical protein